MLRALLALGRALGGGLEAYVQPARGLLYLLDLHPRSKRARLQRYQLDEEQSRRFLWGGGPPGQQRSPGPGHHPEARLPLGAGPHPLGGGPPPRAPAPGAPLGPGEARGQGRLLLDLRDYAWRGRKTPGRSLPGGGGKALGGGGPLVPSGAQGPKRRGACPTHGGGPGKGLGRGDAGRGETVLFSLALEGKPLAEFPQYRDYLRRLLEGEKRFREGVTGLCTPAAGKGCPWWGTSPTSSSSSTSPTRRASPRGSGRRPSLRPTPSVRSASRTFRWGSASPWSASPSASWARRPWSCPRRTRSPRGFPSSWRGFSPGAGA